MGQRNGLLAIMRHIVTTDLDSLIAFAAAADAAIWPDGPPPDIPCDGSAPVQITQRYADILEHPDGGTYAYPLDPTIEGVLAWQKPESDGSASREAPMSRAAQTTAATRAVVMGPDGEPVPNTAPMQALHNFDPEQDAQELDETWSGAAIVDQIAEPAGPPVRFPPGGGVLQTGGAA